MASAAAPIRMLFIPESLRSEFAGDGHRVDPAARYLFQHAGPDASDLELAQDLPVLARARLLEQKDLLRGDHVPFHPRDLTDAGDPALPVGAATQLNDHLQRPRDGLLD